MAMIGTTGSAKVYSSYDDMRNKTDVRAMSIATALFFMWGLMTSLNDILIPHFKDVFELTHFQSMFVQTAFFAAFFVFALPAGKLVESLGYKKTMVTGLLVAAVGALLFLPASTAASFNICLFALVVLATGITCLQVSANPYVTSLGPEKTASSRLNLSQAFNSLGTILGPYVGGLLILGAAQIPAETLRSMAPAALHAYRVQELSSVRPPYIGIAAVLVVLAVALSFLKLPTLTNQDTQDFRPGAFDEVVGLGSIFSHKWLLLGAVGIFLYVGAEVSIGSFLIKYFQLPEISGITEQSAAKFVAFYWGGAMVGRFLGSALLTKFRTGMVLGVAAGVAALLVLTSMLTHGPVAFWSIIAVGLFNSVMFPNIFSLGLSNLGPLTSKGSSLMVMAIVGGALLPLLQGKLADQMGIQHAFFIPVLCYVFIAVFGFAARGLMASPVPYDGDPLL